MIENILASYWNIQILNVELLITALSFLITAFVGISVYLSNPRSWTNIFFILLAVVFDAYIVVNYISLHPPSSTPEDRLYWIRLVMFTAAFKSPVLFLFAHTFPGEKILLKTRYMLGTLSIMLLTAAICLSSLVFQSIIVMNNVPTPIPGSGMALFILDFAGFFILSVFVLEKKYKNAAGEEKSRQKLLLIAILISFSLYGIVILTSVVFFHVTSFVFSAPLFLAILMLLIGYTIVKYKLFNIKVLLTEALTLVLCIVLFARIFSDDTISVQIVDSLVLTLVAVSGYFLVRSVRSEVQQRERIQKLAEELERYNEQLSEFMSLATHEIRNPATFIKGFTAGALEGDLGELSPTIKDGMQKLYIRANDIIHLGNQYLNKSKLELNQLNFEFVPLDMRKLVEDLMHEFEPAAQQQGVVLHTEVDPAETYMVQADTGKMKEVVANLIDNSIKYTQKGSVTVALSKSDQSVKVQITDTGVGIPAEVIPKLFQKFSRADAQKANILGTGLGLYLAKIFIDSHHGTIGVKSEGKNKGSTFTIELPLTQPAKPVTPSGA